MRYHFIMDNRESFPVEETYEVFGLSRSGRFAWAVRKPRARQVEDTHASRASASVYDKTKGRYGHRPIYDHLQDEGIACGHDRTLRLMKEIS